MRDSIVTAETMKAICITMQIRRSDRDERLWCAILTHKERPHGTGQTGNYSSQRYTKNEQKDETKIIRESASEHFYSFAWLFVFRRRNIEIQTTRKIKGAFILYEWRNSFKRQYFMLFVYKLLQCKVYTRSQNQLPINVVWIKKKYFYVEKNYVTSINCLLKNRTRRVTGNKRGTTRDPTELQKSRENL